jgi:hypothetical protein
MSMRKLLIAVVSLALTCTAWTAEPASTPTKAPVKAQTAKPTIAKKATVKPKYYYVRATPLVALPMAASPVPDAKVQEAVAGEVHTGHMVCELGNTVTVTPDPHQTTRFIVQMKKNTYYMTPVETTTGAVRLEDAQTGAMWLQLPHKSMLMNSKLGQRMADECQNDHQTSVAHAMKLNPPPSLLDNPTLAKK